MRFVYGSTLMLLLSWAGGGSALGAQAARRPNIIFLLTDDQRFDAIGYRNDILKTPHMDRLAASGVDFGNAFVTTSICAASRASLFTGLVERTHRYTFGTPPLRATFTDCSYPTLLRRAGYRTGFVGKFGVGVERGATGEMFDSFVKLGRNPYFKKQPDGSVRHLTDITGDKAIEFLRSCRKDQPFCLSVSFNAPHAEDSDPNQYIWPEAFDDLYTDATIDAPALSAPRFFDKQPEFIRNSMNRIRWKWRFDTPEKYQRMVKGYYRMISGVDAVIGLIREELRCRGVAGNTIVILMADNGYFLGDRGFAGKWQPHEPSLRVPLVICDPRLPASRRGKQTKTVALNIDIAPTLLDLAGVEVPATMQGRSLVPILRGQAPDDWRTRFFHEHLFDHRDIPKYEGVRTPRYKYARWFEQKPIYEELYDMQADPLEARNLASDARHADLLGKMRKRCDGFRDSYGGPYAPNPRKPKPKRNARSRRQ